MEILSYVTVNGLRNAPIPILRSDGHFGVMLPHRHRNQGKKEWQSMAYIEAALHSLNEKATQAQKPMILEFNHCMALNYLARVQPWVHPRHPRWTGSADQVYAAVADAPPDRPVHTGCYTISNANGRVSVRNLWTGGSVTWIPRLAVAGYEGGHRSRP